jgi:glycyl-tRNA synthetase
VRITRDLEQTFAVNPLNFAEKAEESLYTSLLQAETSLRLARPGSPDSFLTAFLPMIPAVNRFFDEVLVMAEDATLRQNRLAILQRIVSLAGGIADMSRLEGF